MIRNMVNISYKYLVLIKLRPKDNYIQTDFASSSEFQQFINKTKQKSVIQSHVEVSNQDKLVTLSTCEDAYNQTSGRIVVVAKLVKIN